MSCLAFCNIVDICVIGCSGRSVRLGRAAVTEEGMRENSHWAGFPIVGVGTSGHGVISVRSIRGLNSAMAFLFLRRRRVGRQMARVFFLCRRIRSPFARRRRMNMAARLAARRMELQLKLFFLSWAPVDLLLHVVQRSMDHDGRCAWAQRCTSRLRGMFVVDGQCWRQSKLGHWRQTFNRLWATKEV